MFLDVKALISAFYFCNKIFYADKNYVHHGTKHPRQEVGESLFYILIFVR